MEESASGMEKDRSEIKEQIELLTRYSQKEKLTLQKEIEELIEEEKLELARSKSEVFLEKLALRYSLC
jgi:hypothetical protein